MENTAGRKRKQVPEEYLIKGIDPHKKKHAAVAIAHRDMGSFLNLSFSLSATLHMV